jgi:two-component SAPR family response regulator
MRKRIIIVDPIRENMKVYINMLKQGGLRIFDLINTSSLQEAKYFLTLQPINLIIVNAKFVDEKDLAVYEQALRYHPSVKFVFLHSRSEKEHTVLPQNSYCSNAQAMLMLLRKASTCLT